MADDGTMKGKRHLLSAIGAAAFLVAVIALCTTFFLPRLTERSDIAKRRIARGDIESITMACKLFRLDYGRWPSNSEGLNALLQNPGTTNWRGPYMERPALDPWGRPYRYLFNPNADSKSSAASSIASAGPDGRFGTADDVRD